tara:strand:+ start:122 stop:892 length:771 start_codon:yes stop_codon:yes gene_type:complete
MARPLTRSARRRLVCSVDGYPFTGKTHFMLTMPRPLTIFNIDYGLEGVVEHMEDEEDVSFDGVEVEDYTLEKAPVGSSAAHARAQHVARDFREKFLQLLAKRERQSIGLDTCSEFWQLFRLGDLGKLEQVPPMRYVRVNRIFRDLMNQVLRTRHNLVLVHRLKDAYDTQILDGKEVSTKVPGESARDGFKEIDGIVQVTLETWRKDRPNKTSQYGFTVGKCRQRPSLTGTRFTGALATFPTLGMDVFPKSEPEEWE